jgi:ABC-type multidrug transport system ATPase subunit
MSDAFALRAVSKRFGATHALRGIDLVVPRGSVFGLIGPNGAGKTTTMSVISGFLRPDTGSVEVLGGLPDAMRTKGRLSALPQDAVLGREMKVRAHLVHFGLLQGLPRERAEADTDRALAVVGLTDAARRKAKTLSHGMLKAVGVAQAFLGDPELVLLDEPTAGLDPRRAFELREAIAAMRGTRAVVVSSHNLHELEKLCDRAAFLEAGKVVACDEMSALLRQDEEVRIVLGAGPAPLDGLAGIEGVAVRWDEAERCVHLRFTPGPGREAEDVIGLALRALLDGGARVSSVGRGQTLERRYLELT